MKIFLSTEYGDLLKNLLTSHGDLLTIDPQNADIIICTDLIEGLVLNNKFPQALVIVITSVDRGAPMPKKMFVVSNLIEYLEAV